MNVITPLEHFHVSCYKHKLQFPYPTATFYNRGDAFSVTHNVTHNILDLYFVFSLI